MKKEYRFIAPHIVGSPAQWSCCYDTDHVRHSTPKKAVKALWKAIGSDDGWVAEVDKKGKVIALFNASDNPLGDRRDGPEEIADINKEFGHFS